MAIDKVKDQSKWASASLCIYSDTVHPDAISLALAVTPTHSHRKGQSVSRNSTILRERSAWIFESDTALQQNLSVHLESILDFVKTNCDALDTLSGACDVKLRCAFASTDGQGSAIFNSVLLHRLADSGLELTIDLFPKDAGVEVA